MSIVLFVLLGALAFTTRQPPPPTIAEFAPQAVEQISDAPEELATDFGAGGGGSEQQRAELEAQVVARDDADRVSVAERARVRRCVGNPPRQIEDPQSPPCVPAWTGDNGGATSRGVTRDEIRICIPTPGGNPSPRPPNYFANYEAFFNSDTTAVVGGTRDG